MPHETTPQGPRGNRSRLADRRAGMPIIDASRPSWSRSRQTGTGRALWRFAWLRLLRPLVLTLLWIVAVRYAWTHFFGLPDELPIWQQVALYGVAVALILVLMLGLAPLRRREVQREPQSVTGESTLSEMSDFAGLQPQELDELQRAQRLVVHHDSDGSLHRAEDTARLLGKP